MSVMDDGGWIDGFTSLSTVFRQYQNDARVIMKGSLCCETV